MKVYIVFRDGKPYNIIDKSWATSSYERFLSKDHPDHKWEIKRCELKVI
jgi:hypothetical protein